MKAFVTGGAGFVGSHLVDYLLETGHIVTIYDNLSSGRKIWIGHHFGENRFRFTQGDLLDFNALKESMRGHEVVWHFAANADIRMGNEIVDLDLKNGTLATFNVLEAMRQNGIRKIIFPSSSTVYGEPKIIPTPEDAGPLLPISLYGASKLACEGLISAYCHLFNMRAWIFRFGNVLGGRASHTVILDFIQKLKRNPKELEILGDGNQEKNYFLVEDCIEGMLCAFHNSNEPCNVFNLGCDSTVKVSTIAQIVIKEIGLKDVLLRYTGGKRGWSGDVPIVRFDLRKIKELGWKAKHTSTEAVQIATRRLLEEDRFKET